MTVVLNCPQGDYIYVNNRPHDLYRCVAFTTKAAAGYTAGPYPDITPSSRVIAPNDPKGTTMFPEELKKRGKNITDCDKTLRL